MEAAQPSLTHKLPPRAEVPPLSDAERGERAAGWSGEADAGDRLTSEERQSQIDIELLQEIVSKLPQLDAKKLADRVYREIERKLRFDRQTRGM